jgi:hypothetical protein
MPGRKAPATWARSKECGRTEVGDVSAGRPPIRRESVMRGRHAIGPEIAERAEGSDLARRRLRVVLETIVGSKRVLEACAELDISEQRFETIRQEAIQAGVAALEFKPAGRPRKAAADEQVAVLQERITELEAQLQAALLRAELATALPRLGGDAGKKH